MRNQNEYNLVLPMIETRQAVENIDAILDVPGISGIYVGPSDLAFSMGKTPALDTEDPEQLGMYEVVLAACRQRGIEGLDRSTHNQAPIDVPELERLARDYAAARRAEWRKRKDQVKTLLRDALLSFDRSDADIAGLIRDLFFGSDTGTVRRGPSDLLRAAQDAYREPSEARFREVLGHFATVSLMRLMVSLAPSPPCSCSLLAG